MGLNTDSSPFQSSPLDGTSSPRLFWQNRNVNRTENELLYGGGSPLPNSVRRSSIERLQKASRVKNSTMFAREQKNEYDPARLPTIERPLAKVQGNTYASTGAAGFRPSHSRTESQTSIPFYSPTKSPTRPTLNPGPQTPSKDQTSPIKSSLSTRFKSSQDSQTDIFTDQSFDDHELPTGRFLHRHAKSVTFDAAPPQINEYEMATPDLSSIGTNSREGSFEDDEDDDYIYGHYPGEDGEGQDDSFDATLEDTDKTPVVGPDDWRQDRDSRFDSSPMPESVPSPAASARPQHSRTDSSNSDHRPLPPLPGMGHTRSQSGSSNGLSATAERMLGSPRSLPSPPPASVSKSEIHNIGNGNMSLEERLKLMMLSDETSPKAADSKTKTFAEQQRERRMRRAGARDRVTSPTPEREDDSVLNEEDDTVGDLSALELDYQLPSISRQSILRRVNGNNALGRESDFNFSSPGPDTRDSSVVHSTPYDPDVPIASIEDSVLDDVTEQGEDSVIIHESEDDKGDVYDLYQRSEDEDAASQKDSEDDDLDSHYSDEVQKPQPGASQLEEDSITTPRAASPATEGNSITNFSATLPQVNNASKETEFTRSLQSHMLPKPKEAGALTHSETHRMSDAQAYLQRPYTPEPKPMSKPEYDGSGWGEPEEDEEEEEPGTPESVIHHPISDDEEDEVDEVDEVEEPEELEEELEEAVEVQLIESPAIPEREATIKASGSNKLKTRASATPSDIMAMREARRQVSREVAPVVPPIPERHRSRLSRDLASPEQLEVPTGDDFLERHPSFKQRSLTLDLDLGLSLDQDLDRVIEAQKVAPHTLSYEYEFPGASATASATSKQLSSVSRSSLRRSSSQRLSRQLTQQKHTSAIPSPQKPVHANNSPTKQRGYLMRQNTKLVTASDKDTEEVRAGTRSAGNSPVKQQRPQSWTVEPWNGKHRRSIKKRHTPSTGGPAPPLPGQESNATTTTMDPLLEEDGPELATEECGERGRLFVKVMGAKDLELPLPKSKSFVPQLKGPFSSANANYFY